MAKRLVWMCGGVVAVGVLVHLCVASATHEVDQAQARPAAPSTPALAVQGDPVLGIEIAIQKTLMKNGYLVPPPPEASAQEQRAYQYALDAKQEGKPDSEAIRAAAQKLWDEKAAERKIRMQENKLSHKERADRERMKVEEHKAARDANMSPEAKANRDRIRASETPVRVRLPDLFQEDPENPITPAKDK